MTKLTRWKSYRLCRTGYNLVSLVGHDISIRAEKHGVNVSSNLAYRGLIFSMSEDKEFYETVVDKSTRGAIEIKRRGL